MTGPDKSSMPWNSAFTRAFVRCCYIVAAMGTFSAAGETRAQEAKEYTLRYDPKFQVGDRWRLTKKSSHGVTRSDTPAEGKANVSGFKNDFDFEGTCTAKSVSKNGAWTEISVEVVTCTIKNGSETIEILKSGESLIVVEKDGTRAFKLADGGALFAEKQRLLETAIGGSTAKDETPLEKIFVLETPRKVGETWKCDSSLLPKALLAFSKDAAKGAQVSAEFSGVEEKDGIAALKWTGRMKVESKNPPVGVPGGVPVFGSFDWKSEQTVPATGDRGKWRTVMTADIKQVFKGKPDSDEADTTYEGASKQFSDTTIEFLDAHK
jgi:hypothetical protein